MTALTTSAPIAAAMPTVIETGALARTLRVLKLSGKHTDLPETAAGPS